MSALFASVGLGSTGYIATVAVAPLVAKEMLGEATWSGIPAAAAIFGVAAGTSFLSFLMSRHGRRFGLIAGYVMGSMAAAVGVAAMALASFPLLLAALFFFGAGFSSNYLARYAAADLYPVSHQATAISWIVWAGTIGAVLGPGLLQPAEKLAASFKVSGMAGAYVVGAVSLAAAALVLYFVTRTESFPRFDRKEGGETIRARPLAELLLLPGVKIALLAMVVSQVVMVLIMAMTPIHIRDAGQSLASVGVVIAAHTFGMFALAPLCGFLSDRFGRIPMIVAGGLIIMISALLSFSARGDQQTLLATALFLLGFGWNFGFVAGSALLTESVAANERIPVQGLADTLMRLTAATASLSSGVLLAAWGYPVLSLLGGLFALLPILAAARYRRLPAAEQA